MFSKINHKFVTASEHHNGTRVACLILIDGKYTRPCTLELGHKGEHEEDLPTQQREITMKTVWTEDDATPGTDGHVTLSAAWKKRYNEEWSDARKTAVEKEDCGDCMVFTMPDGRVAYESYPGANEIHEPDNYVPVYKPEPVSRLEEEYNWNERNREPF